MKKVLLAISALFILTTSSQSKEIEGEMICTVKSNYVVSISEGKPEFYSGIEGSFAKGDSLIFKFFTDSLPGFVQIKLLYKDKVLASRQISNSKYSSDKIELKSNGFTYGSRFRSISFFSDYILLRNGMREFRIERYYKGDWSGIISNWFSPDNGGIGETIATLDCRQSSDRVDDFVKYVREMVIDE